MPTITVTWNSLSDARSCETCRGLHGHTWTFTDTLPITLEDKGRVVWDLRMDQSRAHGLDVHNCRCFVTYDIDDSDLYGDLLELESGIEDLDGELDRLADVVFQMTEGIMG